MEKTNEEAKLANSSNCRIDCVLTEKNRLSAFKRILHCLHNQDSINISVTRKNMKYFDKLIRDISSMFNIIIISSNTYKIGNIDYYCKTVKLNKI